MAEIVGAIFGAFSCLCGAPTCNCIDQYRNFNDDVDELRRKLDSLTSQKQDIESRIKEAEACGGQMVRQQVQEWLKQAQEVNDKVRAFLEKVQGVKWYKRACLGRLVCRKMNTVTDMLGKGSFPEGLVIERAPAHGNIIPTENLVGEISTKEEIWGYLMGDEVGMIGVCGIGGVGKTTIMKNLHNDLQRETRFEKVIWVTVSHPLSVFELQKKIAIGMGKSLRDDEEVIMRAAALMEIMRGVRYVLILDDVWDKFSLNEVGIPDPKVQSKCKVVITSRSTEVYSYLDCKIVKVQPLSQEESLALFLKTIGDGVLKIPGLLEILKLVVKECAGLPLAIVVIAGSMKRVDDIKVWRNALRELQNGVKSVKGSGDEIFVRLKFSYDRLGNSKIQKCFLYCSLFREDFEFSREELIEGWIDEGLIDELGSRQAKYDSGHDILNSLQQNFLLEECVGRDRVKMHDVVRDMAIQSIGLGCGYMVKAGMKLKKVPNEREWVDLKKVSLMANDILKIPTGLSPKCRLLSTLILSNNPNLSEISSSFFEDMVVLKVLDLSHTGVEALPNSISNLVNLSALRLRMCSRLKNLPSLAKLRALKKLDLRWAGIEVVPQGMEMLVSLEYLDLNCHKLKEIPTRILPSLSSLQYLVVYPSGGPSGGITKSINIEEVVSLSNLESLESRMEVQDFNYLVNKSKDFDSFMAYAFYLTGEREIRVIESRNPYQRKVLIGGCEIGEECVVLPNTLEDLWINGCRNTKNMRCNLNKTVLFENATELRRCRINSCKGIECIVELNSSSSLCCPVLDKLEELNLYKLYNLSALVRVEGVATPPHIFSNLKILKIGDCSAMRNLVPLELLQALQNLEEIEVRDCKQMEEIIASSDSDASSSNKFTLTFSKLRILRLVQLPLLKSICSGTRVMVCDSIEQIVILECPELKRIPLQFPLLDNGQPSPPPCLEKIEIDDESEEWWESVVELDHPNAKNILQSFLEFAPFTRWAFLDKQYVRIPSPSVLNRGQCITLAL